LWGFQWHGWSAGRFPEWTGVKNQSIVLDGWVLDGLVVGSIHGVSTIV